jgi:hypothetical protein
MIVNIVKPRQGIRAAAGANGGRINILFTKIL